MGDLHGSVSDLCEIFRLQGVNDTDGPADRRAGSPSEKVRYIFDGDFVDRGQCGVEVLCIVLAFQAVLPNAVTLIRGNHEDLLTVKTYSFHQECMEYPGEARHSTSDQVTRSSACSDKQGCRCALAGSSGRPPSSKTSVRRLRGCRLSQSWTRRPHSGRRLA